MRRAAFANRIPWSGIGSVPGDSSDSHASVQSVRSWRAGLPVIDRERTVSRDVAASRLSTTTCAVSDSATVSQIEPVHTPAAPSASAGRHLAAAADAARREHQRAVADRVDHLGDQHHRRDLAAVPAGLGALRDEDVDAVRDVVLRVADAPDERADVDAVLVGRVDRVLRHRPERVDQHLHVRGAA